MATELDEMRAERDRFAFENQDLRSQLGSWKQQVSILAKKAESERTPEAVLRAARYALQSLETDDARKAFIESLAEGFCMDCGSRRLTGPCYCTNDE